MASITTNRGSHTISVSTSEVEAGLLDNNQFLVDHFAGEDLAEIDSQDDAVENEIAREDDRAACTSSSTTVPTDQSHLAVEIAQRQPLLGRRLSKASMARRARPTSIGQPGDATVMQAALMLFKSFIGTGVLFMGKAFYNGGILFSSITLIFIALISLHSILLLVNTKFVVSGSFGDMGGALYGPWMRYSILFSITISQIGFVAVYMLFVSQNLQAIIMAMTNCLRVIPLQYIILLQFTIFVPLVLIRNLSKLSTTALVVDVFILLGLLYVFGSEATVIAKDGVANVKLFNPKDFPLFIGTAVFSFEGICLVIPITDSMREPRKFPSVMTGVICFLLILFGGAGILGYLAFGSNIQPIVTLNLDAESPLVQIVQLFYSAAILLSGPITLFPAVRIMEHGLFVQSGKESTRIKWTKNAFRTSVVLLCTAISWVGAADLDKFVAFVGSFCCVPLCYTYPALLHYRACARTRWEKFADIALVGFGVTATIYTTAQTLTLWILPEPGGSPTFGKCPA